MYGIQQSWPLHFLFQTQGASEAATLWHGHFLDFYFRSPIPLVFGQRLKIHSLFERLYSQSNPGFEFTTHEFFFDQNSFAVWSEAQNPQPAPQGLSTWSHPWGTHQFRTPPWLTSQLQHASHVSCHCHSVRFNSSTLRAIRSSLLTSKFAQTRPPKTWKRSMALCTFYQSKKNVFALEKSWALTNVHRSYQVMRGPRRFHLQLLLVREDLNFTQTKESCQRSNRQ